MLPASSMPLPADFTSLPDLAAERFGGAVIDANDEFFAPKECLLRAAPAEWREANTRPRQWMDGWETRRRREPVSIGRSSASVPGIVPASWWIPHLPRQLSRVVLD